ncbi:MAG: ribosome biogenesis GTP-binding protein YihA/YsxC [Cyclobacteriaceae bacterium]
MLIQSAEFVISNTDFRKAPPPDKPEFAFIGRSNVGKSSLINSLVGRKGLAKTSAKPGKTQTINHFLINQNWFLVDLPGYGYAGVSKTSRHKWGKMIESYLLNRESLYCTFVLVDSRHEPQSSDIDFINWLGEKQLPLAIVLTKVDKISRSQIAGAEQRFKKKLSERWEELPKIFVTSAEKKAGLDPLLDFIEKAIREQK